MVSLNLYGDSRIPTISGHGVDIASQRIDDLDHASLNWIGEYVLCNGRAPVAFDLGCGFGAHSMRMVEAGADVLAVDLDDNRHKVLNQAVPKGLASRIRFVQMDIRKGLRLIHENPSLVYSQRTFHYLRFSEAVEVLSALSKKNKQVIRFFISASGIDSELGEGYQHRNTPLEDRYCELTAAMQEKHSIYGNVCLYSVADMNTLLKRAGLRSISITASSFGNIKAIAESCTASGQ